MIRPRTIRKLARQTLTWSAMLMMLVQPVSLIAADCGCCSREGMPASTTCCANNNTEKSCCSRQASDCCVAKASCCSVSDSRSQSPCKCGDDCRCSQRDQPLTPQPAIPTNDSGHDQLQLVLLAIQSSCFGDCVCDDPCKPRPESASYRSSTAQQVCVLLSRFTC